MSATSSYGTPHEWPICMAEMGIRIISLGDNKPGPVYCHRPKWHLGEHCHYLEPLPEVLQQLHPEWIK